MGLHQVEPVNCVVYEPKADVSKDQIVEDTNRAMTMMGGGGGGGRHGLEKGSRSTMVSLSGNEEREEGSEPIGTCGGCSRNGGEGGGREESP